MTSRSLWIGLSLLSVTLLSGCSEAVSDPLETGERPVKLHQVSIAGGERTRQFPAVVEAAEAAQLAFRVAGELTKLPAQPGRDVAQGDLIAKLDATDYQLVVDEAKARYDLAASQFARSEKLVKDGLMSQAQYDEIKANLDVSRANLDTARANLGYTELRAPFAGSIARLYVENYENVQPQQQIATLQLSDAIDISIRVPENLFARVQRRSEATVDVIFDASPGQRYKAQLKEWDTSADPATNTYKVVFTMPKPMDLNALPGMSATVEVDTRALLAATERLIVIPAQAVFSPLGQEQGEQRFVWVYDPQSQQVEQREVTVGEITNHGIEILSGLSVDEQIVVAGVHQLEPGQRVRPWVRERGL